MIWYRLSNTEAEFADLRPPIGTPGAEVRAPGKYTSGIPPLKGRVSWFPDGIPKMKKCPNLVATAQTNVAK